MVSQSATEGNTLRLTGDQSEDERKLVTWTSAPLQSATDIGIGNDGKPQRQPQGPGKNPRAFTVTILQDAAPPPRLTLPVIGDVPAALRQ